MSFFRTPSAPTTVTSYSGLQVQTTSACVPIPIVYGENMLSCNAIWYNNFQAHLQNGSKGGGKGTGGGATTKSGQVKTYTYTAAIILALCEGPIHGIGYVWQTSNTPENLAYFGLSAFNGTTPQTAWSYVTANYPAEALPYGGLAYAYSSNLDLGSSASVGSYTFEIQGVLYGTAFNGIDAEPGAMIYDFLTNIQYGVGFPSASIDTASLLGATGTAGYLAYCWAAGLALSPALNSQENAASIITRWLQLTNSTCVWTGGVLKFVPYGDTAITANGMTFSPNITPIYTLTDDDFIQTDGEDPVIPSRTNPYAAYNFQSMEICSRAYQYITGPVPVFDQSMIDRFGLRAGSSITAHEICDIGIAQISAQLILQRALYIRNTYKFKLDWIFCLLDPTDIVTLVDTAIGLNGAPVRITDIDEDSDGFLTFTAEEFPQGAGSAVLYPIQGASNGVPISNVAAPAINVPLIIEPPPQISGGAVQLWVAVSSASPIWGGCNIFASLDNVTYANIGTIAGASVQGVTTSSLTAYGGANPDTGETLGVDLTESIGSLGSTTGPNAAAGVSLCYVGGEYIAYTTATLTAADKYNLTGLYRGMFGIPPQAIASGAPFAFLGSGLFKYDLPTAEIGQILYLKFQSINIYGSGIEDISTCTVYTYGITGAGVLGPVTSALAAGTALDYGLITAVVSESDDFGKIAGDPASAIIDLGKLT